MASPVPISLSALLLRVVLSLALVLNGAGGALAAGHAAMESGIHAVESGVKSPAAHLAVHCHGDATASSSVPASGAAEAPSSVSIADHEAVGAHGDSACCDDDSCQCIGVNGSAAGAPQLATDTWPARSTAVRDLPRAEFPAPALPHLIRPPIA
jgi:hypothetical protein